MKVARSSAVFWMLLSLMAGCVAAQGSGTSPGSGTTPPSAQPLSCNDLLMPPVNGAIQFSSLPPYLVGATATYSCNEGYVPVLEEGTLQRVCRDIGDNTASWDGSAISCQQEIIVACMTSLSPPENAVIQYSAAGPPYPVGTTASYSCIEGYSLVIGEEGSSAECVNGDGIGFWNEPSVSCQPVEAVEMPSVVVTTSQAVTEAGGTAVLFCTITFAGTPTKPYNITWQDSTGSDVVEVPDEISISEAAILPGGGVGTLTFQSVFTSQAGAYTCTARVESSEFGVTIAQDTATLLVQIAPLSVFVSSSLPEPYIGQELKIICTLAINVYTDINITPTVRWEASYIDDGVTIDQPITTPQLMEITPAVYTSTLELNPVLRDMVYTCFVTADPAASSEVIMGSAEANETLNLSVDAPPLVASVTPLSAVIASVPPYNNVTLTCRVSLPDDVTGLEITNFQWSYVDLSESSQNYNSDQTDMRTGDYEYSSVLELAVAADAGSGSGVWRCVFDVFANAIETLVESGTAAATVSVKGSAPPAGVSQMAVLSAATLAVVEWTVPLISFTPETYEIQYLIFDDSPEVVTQSVRVESTRNISAVNQRYQVVIEGLQQSSHYEYRIVAINEIGNTSSEYDTFSTSSPTDAVLLPNHSPPDLLSIPIGARIQLEFQFSHPFGTSQFQLVPLYHSPLQSPVINLGSSSIVFNQASPSLTGEYILCRLISFESRKKRNFIGPMTECTEKFTLQVYTPSLSISTSLLVATVDDSFTAQSPTISCIPSDPLAPVRWRSFLGTYNDRTISTTYEVQVDDGLGQTVTLPLGVYEGGPPDRIEILYCDLINIEQDSSLETDPQSVTVRFLRKSVAILNNDRELDSPAVINTFSSFLGSTDLHLSLRCFSATEENLIWEAIDVPGLGTGPLTTGTLPSYVTVDYLQGVNVNNRDVLLQINPFASQTSGHYSCRPASSSSNVTVLATTIQPYWRQTSPSFRELPIGAYVSFSALYADFSDGMVNNGLGFNVNVRFLGETILGESSNAESVTLVNSNTERQGNVFEYSFIASNVDQSGLYEIEAFPRGADDGEQGISDFVELRVTFPFFLDPESSVFVRAGDIVTLRCLPNDTRTPVQWSLTGFNDLINSRQDLFTLSPPMLNHTISFNGSLVASQLFNYRSGQVFTSSYNCGLFRSLLTYRIELTVQPELIRLEHSDNGFRIFGNTVINVFQRSSDYNTYPDYDYGDRKRNANYAQQAGSGQERLEVRCSAAQGSNRPQWYTNNPLLGDESGAVTCTDSSNNQIVESNYVARLRLYNLEENVEGIYTCRSQIANEEQSFLLDFENPFVAPITPPVKEFIEGQPLEVRFRIAVNSDGNTWETSRTSFSFTGSAEDLPKSRNSEYMTQLFDNSDSNSPQDYIFSIPQARRSDEGVYTATVREDTGCDAAGCGGASAVVKVNIRRVCPEEVLWPVTLSNTVAKISCTDAGSSFQPGTFISRPCFPDGSWGEVDFTSCTLASDNTTLLLVSLSLLPPDSESDLPFSPFAAASVGETSQFDKQALVNAMQGLLDMTGVQYTSVSVSQVVPIDQGTLVVYEIVLDSNFGLDSLTMFENLATNGLGLVGIGPYRVDPNYPIVIIGIAATASCQCGSGADDSGSGGASVTIVELCTGLSLSPCNCSVSGDCLCQSPYVGDGSRCTLDSDIDSYPDQALVSPSCDQPLNTPPYCTPDNCPTVFNIDQDPSACQDVQEFTGCPFSFDSEWNIEWPNTAPGTTVTAPCPGDLDAVIGQASRYCTSAGEWESVNVLDCQAMEFVELSMQATAVFSGDVVMVEDTVELVEQLAVITEPERTDTPLLPSSLNTTNLVLNSVLDILEQSGNNDTNTADVNQFVFEVLDNVLDLNNTQGWMALQESSAGSQLLLDNTERFGELLARSQNNNTQETVRMSRNNIAISASQYNSSGSIRVEDLRFPLEADLVNYNTSSPPATIEIPAGLVEERLDRENSTFVPVVFLLIQNLESFLPSVNRELRNSTAASSIISSQVGSRGTVGPSQALKEQPVLLNFSFSAVSSAQEYRCVYWNFSDPVGNGSWVSEGVVTMSSTTNCGERVTTVQCNSSHLTSFAVLVDVAGGLRDICDAERIALQIVSYIGCIVSVISLFITVVFFISLGKILLTQSVHYFVHLNLALSLLLAYLIFIVGVETAVGNKAGCAFVAALLHYFFLASFCWMLCEGVMLFLLLVVVFSKVAKWWWFFLLLGYVTPLPFVVVTLAARSDFYGVRDESGNLQFCWLSTEEGTIFGFVAPMIAIILVNVVFLLLSLRALWKNRTRAVRRAHRKETDNQKTIRVAKSVFLASIVLLPLLGLTWVFGLLTVNQNTTVFAWIFTILNSFQGLAILFFHVVRNDRVWGKIKPKFTTTWKNMTQRSSYEPSKASTYSANTGSTKYKSSNVDSELSMGTMKSSVSEPVKQDLGLSSCSEYNETKVDLALEESTAENTINSTVHDDAEKTDLPSDEHEINKEKGVDVAVSENPEDVEEKKKLTAPTASPNKQQENDALVIENTMQSTTGTQARDNNALPEDGEVDNTGRVKTDPSDSDVIENPGAVESSAETRDLGLEVEIEIDIDDTATQVNNEATSSTL